MLKKLISKILISIILFLILGISFNYKPSLKETVFKKMNISFLNNIYNKFTNNKEESDTLKVFNDTDYTDVSKYLNGYKFILANNTILKTLESGLVVYIGDKEEYGNTVIIEGVDGVDIWYSNVSNINVSLYDYIKKGTIIGDSNEYYILTFNKNGTYLSYEEYL